MPLEIQISDNDLKGFSAQARDRLKKATTDYAMNLIEEANRIEAGRNPTTGPPEITRAMVSDANDVLRRGLGVPKRRLRVLVVRILAAILPLCVGITYNDTRLQQSRGYMLFFIVLIALAILSVTISTLNE